jgi:hypothetical protein
LLKGIRLKQLFNFGIPLIVGLAHSLDSLYAFQGYFILKKNCLLFCE